MPGPFRLFARLVDPAASPMQGGAAAIIDTHLVWGTGTGDDQYDKLHHGTNEVAASSNEDVDITALTDSKGAAINPVEVCGFIVTADPDNGDNLEFKAAASNGWTALFGGTTDSFKVAPGATVALHAPKDGSYAVSGTNKVFNVANADGGAAASYTLTILGRSA